MKFFFSNKMISFCDFHVLCLEAKGWTIDKSRLSMLSNLMFLPSNWKTMKIFSWLSIENKRFENNKNVPNTISVTVLSSYLCKCVNNCFPGPDINSEALYILNSNLYGEYLSVLVFDSIECVWWSTDIWTTRVQ